MFLGSLMVAFWPVTWFPVLGLLVHRGGLLIIDEGRQERAFRRSLKKDLS
jgi:hypothetical protein